MFSCQLAPVSSVENYCSRSILLLGTFGTVGIIKVFMTNFAVDLFIFGERKAGVSNNQNVKKGVRE